MEPQPIDEGSHLMSRSVGLAYAVTGAAIASAVIAITASTAGLFDGGQPTAASAAFESAAAPALADQSTGDSGAAPGVGAGAMSTRDHRLDEPAAGRRSQEHERFEHSARGDDDE